MKLSSLYKEGDIVITENLHSDFQPIANFRTRKWNRHECGLTIILESNGRILRGHPWCPSRDFNNTDLYQYCKVLGNIFEDPDLLDKIEIIWKLQGKKLPDDRKRSIMFHAKLRGAGRPKFNYYNIVRRTE